MDDLADCVRIDTRLAGQVKRYHTWPIIGQQTVAEHTWQMLRIYLSVCAKPEQRIMFYIIFHDIGEHYTGDIPYPVKSENRELKERMDMLEKRSWATQLDYWGSFHQVWVGDDDKVLCKMIELVEMAEFGMDQVCLGNAHGYIVANRCLMAVYNMRPPPRLVTYVTKRIRLFFQQCPAIHTGYDLDEDWWFPARWEMKYGQHATHEVSGADSQSGHTGAQAEGRHI